MILVSRVSFETTTQYKSLSTTNFNMSTTIANILSKFLGLYLLGVGFSGNEAMARSADLSPSFPASALDAAKLTGGQNYWLPVNYYKLPDPSASNQIDDVRDLRNPAYSEYPTNQHQYQQMQQERQRPMEPNFYWPLNMHQPAYSDPFGGLPVEEQMDPTARKVEAPFELKHHQVNQPNLPQQLPQQQLASSTTTYAPISAQMPNCAIKLRQTGDSASGENSTISLSGAEVLFCNEDSDYPTREIMRALEDYATEQSIGQLLPQLLRVVHRANQPSPLGTNGDGDVDGDSLDPLQSVGGASQFSSTDYESMCRSSSYIAQPRRARNLLGHWKVVINLPGHMYRGTPVSQMVRVEECYRSGSQCNTPSAPASALGRSLVSPSTSSLPKSHCLQHYESQRLVAWSKQQGLHLDIFRVPIACSCHIRR